MLVELLSKANAPLDRLRLERVMLDSHDPGYSTSFTNEAAIYALAGMMHVYWNGMYIGRIGGRASVTEPLCHVIRFPRTTLENPHHVVVTLEGFAADALCISCAPALSDCARPLASHEATTSSSISAPFIHRTAHIPLPYFHWNDTVWNDVGNDTHARRVAEVPTPPGFELYLGETLNTVGGVSSWPAHANAEDIELYERKQTEWEEAMFFVNPKPGLCVMNGMFSNGEAVDTTVVIENGSAHAMPLGSHRIHAAPDTWLWYFWAYTGNALQKQYRKFSTDVGIYVK